MRWLLSRAGEMGEAGRRIRIVLQFCMHARQHMGLPYAAARYTD